MPVENRITTLGVVKNAIKFSPCTVSRDALASHHKVPQQRFPLRGHTHLKIDFFYALSERETIQQYVPKSY